MESQNVLGMICGYYLSRFDRNAYAALGYRTQSATHHALGDALGVPARSIQNWRDEFDPIHDNSRQGWHKRQMYMSRQRVVEALEDLDELEVYRIISQITQSPRGDTANEIVTIIGAVEDNDSETQHSLRLRGPTGFKAESTFQKFHAEHGSPIPGLLRDCRHEQCGYDFEVKTDFETFAIEVKGLAGQDGGINLTNKEWRMAQEFGDRYFLVVVKNVASDPKISIIQNPADCLVPKMRLSSTVQVNWSVGQGPLRKAESEQIDA